MLSQLRERFLPPLFGGFQFLTKLYLMLRDFLIAMRRFASALDYDPRRVHAERLSVGRPIARRPKVGRSPAGGRSTPAGIRP